jgi:predicted amidohydrolase YtcJ
MLDPYTGTTDRGLPLASYNDARRAMWMAADAGISVTVHAIGDAAVRRAIDLTVELPQVALPHRIEHFQCVHPVDLARPAAAGIVVSMQPAHLLVDIPYVERHWGERGRGAYAFRSLLRSGATVVFGSDVPVASIDPREGIFAALERRGVDGLPAAGWYPEERIGFEATLGAYTRAAAVAGGVAHRRGTLAPGMDADLVAWRVDPAVERDDGEAMRHGLAVLTVVGGEVVMAQ